MRTADRLTFSLRAVVLAVIGTSMLPSALLLHLSWWRTATEVSRDLGRTLETQITEAARRAWWGRVLEIQGLSATLREGLKAARPGQRDRILQIGRAHV